MKKQINLTDLSKRFLQSIDELGLSGYKLSKEIPEITESKLTHIRTGRNEPSKTILESFLKKYPNINKVWLLTGEGEMLNDTKAEKRGVLIPLIGIEAAAGFGTNDFSITEQDIQAQYMVPDFNGIDFMVRVKGNSMYPKYSSGDIVACRKLKESKFIEWNKPHLISTTEHGLIVKRLRKSEIKNCIKAVSDNKEYDPFDIPMNEITGIALVVGVIRLE